MDEFFDFINNAKNCTSAGTSQLSIFTDKGVKEVGIENLSKIDSDIHSTELGKLYKGFPEKFTKIQKITLKDHQFFYNCYFNSGEDIKILRFNSKGFFIK